MMPRGAVRLVWTISGSSANSPIRVRGEQIGVFPMLIEGTIPIAQGVFQTPGPFPRRVRPILRRLSPRCDRMEGQTGNFGNVVGKPSGHFHLILQNLLTEPDDLGLIQFIRGGNQRAVARNFHMLRSIV